MIEEEEFYEPIGAPIHRSHGLTPSERMLQELAEDTFFRLWCYTGPHTDEGLPKRGSGSELCDLLIVFGDDVIIFSDKSIKFNEDIDVAVAWPRWYKKAILESARQVRGAENWIKKYPQRIYLDSKCEHKLPLTLPDPDRIRFHRVLIAANSYLPAKRYFGRNSSGSLVLWPKLPEELIFKQPFSIGKIIAAAGPFHVLNEYSLALLLEELHSLPDFIAYLNAKELLLTSGALTCAHGEEEILAHYFQSGAFKDPANALHFLQRNLRKGSFDGVMLSEGLWDEYRSTRMYEEMCKSQMQAKLWRQTLDDIAQHVSRGTALGPSKEVAAHERIVRVFAEEPIWAQAVLSVALLDKLDAVKFNERSARIVPSPTRPDVLFILLLFPPNEGGQEHVDYRRERESAAQCYALVAGATFANAKRVAIFMTEPMGNAWSTRDFAVFDVGNLSPAEIQEARRLQEEGNILQELTDITAHEIAARVASKRGEAFEPRPIAARRKGACPCGSGKKYKRCHGR